ncbi:MAG: universal stress protein [Phycisphaerales bacterium JB039]
MYRYKHLLVNCTLDDGDASLIRYAAMVASMARAKRVYFAHVAPREDIPPEVQSRYPELIQPVTERAKGRMEELVACHFSGGVDVEVIHEVAEGSPLTEVLRLARHKDIDLVLTGCDAEDRATRSFATRLARKAPCSVLVSPESAKPQIRKILVPVDFSEHSGDALDVAVAFASASGTSTLTVLHVYHVPVGYGKLGVSYEEFSETMRMNALRRYDEFIRSQDLRETTAVPVLCLDDHPAKAIANVVAEQNVDLVVMGARGRGAGAAVLLGSVTERLLHSVNVPLVAVKRKGYGMTVLDALFSL